MKLQKIASLILALIMIFSLGITAFAEEQELGSITINGVSVKDGEPEATYSIYRLLDLESYNTAGEGAYSYKVNPDWEDFFETDEALQYVSIDASGYVTWNKTKETEADYATFAKGALSYAKEKEIDPVKTSATDGDFTVTGTSGVFKDLPLGYYLIDTTMGALCGLTTTNPHASLNAKNGKPTLDLQVEEDSTLQYGKKIPQNLDRPLISARPSTFMQVHRIMFSTINLVMDSLLMNLLKLNMFQEPVLRQCPVKNTSW